MIINWYEKQADGGETSLVKTNGELPQVGDRVFFRDPSYKLIKYSVLRISHVIVTFKHSLDSLKRDPKVQAVSDPGEKFDVICQILKNQEDQLVVNWGNPLITTRQEAEILLEKVE